MWVKLGRRTEELYGGRQFIPNPSKPRKSDLLREAVRSGRDEAEGQALRLRRSRPVTSRATGRLGSLSDVFPVHRNEQDPAVLVASLCESPEC